MIFIWWLFDVCTVQLIIRLNTCLATVYNFYDLILTESLYI